MTATINGRDALSLEITHPRVSKWHCSAEVDGDEALSGSVTITVDGVSWTGTVLRSRGFGGRCRAEIVGGRGGLSKVLDAKHYTDVSASTIARDICQEAGETLDPSVTLTQRFAHWERIKGQASHALLALCDRLGLTWRVLRNGSIWIGVDNWLPVDPKAEVEDEDWNSGSIQLFAEEFSELAKLLPGTIYDGNRIEEVVHLVTPEKTRTIIHAGDSVASALDGFIGQVRRKIEMACSYECVVRAQNADGTLQLAPSDERVAKRGNGLDKVPIRYGLPGFKAKVKSGTIVRLHFDGGDPDKPYATAWDAGHKDAIESIEFEPGGVSVAACRIGDTLEVALPANLPISGIGAAGPFSGVVTITTPARAIITGPGNSKLLI